MHDESIEHKSTQWQSWFKSPLGNLVWEAERKMIEHCLPLLKGNAILQIGGPSLFEAFNLTPEQGLTAYLGFHERDGKKKGEGLREGEDAVDDDATLSFESETFDRVFLMHALERVSDPKALLREVDRVLMDGGKLIIFAFNPWSLWGMAKCFPRRRGNVFPFGCPWYALPTLVSGLRRIGFHLQLSRTLVYRFPSNSVERQRRWAWMEAAGSLMFSGFGGVNGMIFEKSSEGMTLLGSSLWSNKLGLNKAIIKPVVQAGEHE